MIHEHAPKSGLRPVWEGAVEEVTVEKYDGTRFDFDGNRVIIREGEAVGLARAIETTVIVRVLRPEDPRFVGAGYDPETSVLQGCVIQRDPSARQRSVACWDVKLILVPGLTWFPR